MATVAEAEVVGGVVGIASADVVALRSLTLHNVLSFGAEAKVELGPLNVLIGPNGCGKSNLLDVVALLKAAATTDLSDEFRGGGADWPWKGGAANLPKMRVASEWRGARSGELCRHEMAVQVEKTGAYSIVSETAGHPDHAPADMRPKDIEPGVSLLQPHVNSAVVAGDPTPDLNRWTISAILTDIGIYRSRYVGRVGKLNPLRCPSRADIPNGRLREDLDNFAVVLKRVYNDAACRVAVDENAREFNEDARGFRFVNVAKGAADKNAVAVALEEAGGRVILAPRMSDGMLNWLFLLTVLLDPKPPVLVCIDEPETGLHPDMLPTLAEMLIDASKRMQLIVTTHSDMILDCFTDMPEAVVVCDKVDGVTQMKRLCAEDFHEWKEEGLGMAWISGAIGGKRW